MFAVPLLFAVAAVVGLAAINGRPQLTQRDIDEAVQRALASVTPGPSVAAQAYAVVARSVVRIDVTLPEGEGRDNRGVGAGVVIDDAGTILTANHVIQGATHARVTFADGTESAAFILARIPENDTAVLRAELLPDDLMSATLTGSSGLRVGDEVIAVGSPFGLTSSTSSGIVSGLRRSFTSHQLGITLERVIQFDAAVNPGNSGGPLVNRNGEVVGIVTGLLNPQQDSFIGIGFAVPIETAASAAGPPWE